MIHLKRSSPSPNAMAHGPMWMARLVYVWPARSTDVWCGALRRRIPGLRTVTNGSTFLMIAATPSLLMPNPTALPLNRREQTKDCSHRRG
jgi:hypothetical protein